MGNFEKLGILVIIMLVVVILVLTVWGVGQPVDDLGTGIVPRQLNSRGANDQADPPAKPPQDVPAPPRNARVVSSWPEDVPADPPGPITPDPDPAPEPGADLTHTVKDGDSYYGLALHYYRDGTRYPVIQEANPGIDPQSLSVGMTLVIPHPDRVLEDAPRPAPAPIPALPDTYVVKKGDSLWRIAERTLGQGAEFPKILEANRDLLGSNGDDLQVGMTLRIPR
jgi:nucleoid-associated protein YgaU